jgi:acetyl esterase
MYRATSRVHEPSPVGAVEDVQIPGHGGQIPARLYRPGGAGPFPLHVYFHGGGWVIGDLDSPDEYCRETCRSSHCLVLSVDYRLAPEHQFPAAIDDAYAAVCWVGENAAKLGADPNRLSVGGDSAGGNLAATTALRVRDQGGPTLCFQLLIYPVTDASFDTGSYLSNAEGYMLTRNGMAWFWDQYCPDTEQRRSPYASPMQASDLRGLPPALVITAEYDPLRDEGEAYAAALRAADVPVSARRYDGMIHGFIGLAQFIPAARPVIEHACQSLRAAHEGTWAPD